MQTKEINLTTWKLVFLAICISGAGFVLAHALRFGMLVHWSGGVREAIEEVMSRAGKRYAEQLQPGFSTNRAAYTCDALWFHVKGQFTFTTLFLPWSWFIPTLAFLIASCRNGAIDLWWRPAQRLLIRARSYDLLSLFLAILIGVGWIVVMPFHAKPHISWIGRHFFLFYVVSIAIILSRTSFRPKSESAALVS